MKNRLCLLLVATVAAVLSDSGDADACGGCFVPPSDATVVTDHRMALSISPQQTVLWDQIRYSGDPKEFAWVLPVRPGARIEVANDEFFTALDTSSQPIVYAPQRFGPNSTTCGITGCSEDALSALSAGGRGSDVEIVSQSVVGPYDQVTLRATDEDALTSWLRKNEFTIPTAIEPTIDAYVREGFDFIALKLRPACGERAMRPVRVVSPGATPSLPLRMVAAGVGPAVGIILYVITEGKYQPQNFPHALFDDDELRWDPLENKSNYEPLSQAIMSRDNGRTWLTEYADRPQIPLTGTGWRQPAPQRFGGGGVASSRRAQTGLSDLYFGLCKFYQSPNTSFPGSSTSSSSSSSGGVLFTPCPKPDAGNQTPVPFDAGPNGPPEDAGTDAGADAEADAGVDAGAGLGDDDDDVGANPDPDPDPDREQPSGNLARDCAYLDDLDVALTGLQREAVWVTRLRSQLPSSALTDGDLVVEPVKLADGRADTNAVSNLHWAQYNAGEAPASSTKGRCDATPNRSRGPSTLFLAVIGAFVGASFIRRRRRPR